jgi:K+-transporting ATPase ATPase C chain
MTMEIKKQILNEWIPMLKLWVAMLFVIVFVYALPSTILSHIFFYDKSFGSLIHYHHRIVGSSLLGQQFSNPAYFFGRPSMTTYQSDIPQAQDIHWLGNAFWKSYKKQQQDFWLKNGIEHPPSELLFPSSSQLDPHLSLEAVEMQIPRILKNRQISLAELQAIITRHTQKPFLWIFGKTRVNILEVNVGLDQYMEKHHESTHA